MATENGDRTKPPDPFIKTTLIYFIYFVSTTNTLYRVENLALGNLDLENLDLENPGLGKTIQVGLLMGIGVDFHFIYLFKLMMATENGDRTKPPDGPKISGHGFIKTTLIYFIHSVSTTLCIGRKIWTWKIWAWKIWAWKIWAWKIWTREILLSGRPFKWGCSWE